MSDLIWLSGAQMRRIELYFPLSHGVPSVDDPLRPLTHASMCCPLPKRGMTVCIPSKTNRKVPNSHDKTLYRQQHRIEGMFGRLTSFDRCEHRLSNNGRRTHTRYDQFANIFMSAICLAATVSFWIDQCVLNLGRFNHCCTGEDCGEWPIIKPT